MLIKTNQPIIQDRSKITRKITEYWDQMTEGWKTVWGPHIHHGYYENDQPIAPKAAQEKLIEKIAQLLNLTSGQTILDVGCGMGGSSLYLAKNYNATVCGITLSQHQVNIAKKQAEEMNINNINFKIDDALLLQTIPDNSVDIVWSLESCEQFFDKNLFLQQAYRVLKPGGKLMLATWCSNAEIYEGRLARKYKKLCVAFDLPYMPTIQHYRHLLTMNQFHIINSLDWSHYVKKSWNIGISLLNAYSFLQILRISGWKGWRFAKQIKLMRDAFEQRNVQYGVFVGSKIAKN